MAAAKADEKTVQIYVLHDGVSCRYVGKANDAGKRLKSHLRDARRRDTPVYRWIRKLLANGQVPQAWVWTECTEAQWPALERRCIQIARQLGWPLLNVAEGGDEPHCSPEVRARNGQIVAAARAATPEKKQLWYLKLMMGQALREGRVTERTKEKLRNLARRDPTRFGEYATL